MIMRKSLFLILCLTVPLSVSFAQPQDDPCVCKGTNQALQYRTKTKHRKTFSRYPKSKLTITPTTVISWQKKYEDKTSGIGRDNVSKRLTKVKNTPEDTLYTIEGYLYFIKLEDDCDYHMEIGSEDPDETRAVVELTKEFCSQQRHVFEFIQDYLKENNNINIKSYKLRREFKEGIHVRIKGLGFYDGWHQPDEHGRIFTHGSSWELHPVVNVEFIE